jgi:hypothetical protein
VLALDTEAQAGLSIIVQAPTEMLDGVPADAEDRENAIDWVHRLTELVEKAKAYDEIFDDIEDGLVEVDGFHDLHVVEDDDGSNLDAADGTNWDWDRAREKARTSRPSIFEDAVKGSGVTVTANHWLPSDSDANEAYTVDELTDAEADQEWVDIDGDHYKYINDEWYISFEGWRPWASTEGGDSLTAYSPYTAVVA